MSKEPVRHLSLAQPKGGSDYALFLSGEEKQPSRTIFGVFDTIGKHHDKMLLQILHTFEERCREILQVGQAKDVHELSNAVQKEILRLNQEVSAF